MMSKVQQYLNDAVSPNPWFFAKLEGRAYLTPEDVADAIKLDCLPVVVMRVVLEAVERNAAEDESLCAFEALEHFKKNRL